MEEAELTLPFNHEIWFRPGIELAIEDMDGGTFTISNGGVFGPLFERPSSTPQSCYPGHACHR